MLLAPMCGWAEEFTVDGAKYEILTDGTACLVDGSLVKGDLIIPETLKGVTVTRIGKSAFLSNYALTSVTIPKSIQYIGNYAFADCAALSSVISLIENPDRLSTYTFAVWDDVRGWVQSCSAILYVPGGTAQNYIDNRWYENFSGIVEGQSKVRMFTNDHIKYTVEADGSVEIAKVDGHYWTDYLATPESITFEGTTYVPTVIKLWAFQNCYNLQSLIISANITCIDMGSLFIGHNNLTSISVKEGSPVYDSRDNCNAIIEKNTNTLILGCKNTTIPTTVQTIGNYAFCACDSLTTITLPDNLKSIGEGAFMWSGLTSIELPAGLTNIGPEAFECNNLVSVASKIKKPFKLEDYTFTVFEWEIWTFYTSKATLYVPTGTIEEYKKMGWVRQFAKIVEGEPGEVFKESGATYQAQSGNTVAIMSSDVVEAEFVIPEIVTYDGLDYTVTTINYGAFIDNTVLMTVTIPKTVEIIGDGAFAGCSNLSAIYAYATEPAHLAATASRTRANDASSVFEGVDKENCILYVPKGCVEKYRAAEGWGEFVQIVEMEGMGISSLSPCRSVFEVYDMNGRKVRTATTSLDGLPKGIYIVNGRKVMK